jgi:hypothetical protein
VATVPVWVVAAVKPVLPLPAPLMPIRLPPKSVKVPAGLLASGPARFAVLVAIMVFWTLKVLPAVPPQKMPPPLFCSRIHEGRQINSAEVAGRSSRLQLRGHCQAACGMRQEKNYHVRKRPDFMADGA